MYVHMTNIDTDNMIGVGISHSFADSEYSLSARRDEERQSELIKGSTGTEDRGGTSKKLVHSYDKKPSKPSARMLSKSLRKNKNNVRSKPPHYEGLNSLDPPLVVDQPKGGGNREAVGMGVKESEVSKRATVDHLGIDVIVDKWMLEVKVNDKVVSVCSY